MDALDNRTPTKIAKGSSRYETKSVLGKKAIQTANILCECDPQHEAFLISVDNGTSSYMEEHHIIPMRAQEQFDINNPNRSPQ